MPVEKLGLVLHIGQAKTGTSSIQHDLSARAQALRAVGAFYPSAARQGEAHHKLAAAFLEGGRQPPWLGDATAEDLCAELRREIQQNVGLRPVLSSETFFTVSPRALDVRKTLGAENVSIVLILRRQDSWLDSLYQHQLKTLETHLSPEAWFRQVLRSPVINFRERTQYWESAFGRNALAIGGYHSADNAGGIVRYFYKLAGLPLPAGEPVAERVNPRMARDCVEVLQRLHFQCGYDRLVLAPLRAALAHYPGARDEPEGWAWAFSPEQRKHVMDVCRADNEALCSGRAEGDLHRELLCDTVSGPYQPYPGLASVSAERIADYLRSSGVADEVVQAVRSTAGR